MVISRPKEPPLYDSTFLDVGNVPPQHSTIDTSGTTATVYEDYTESTLIDTGLYLNRHERRKLKALQRRNK